MKTLSMKTRNTRKQRGIAMVEFVISAPVVLFIALAIAEMGYAIMTYNTLTQGIRDGARHVSRNAIPTNAPVLNVTDDLIEEAQNLVTYGEIGVGEKPIVPGLTPGNVTVAVDDADLRTVSITVAYDYQPLLISIPQVYTRGDGDDIEGVLTMNAGMIVGAIR